MTPHQVKEGYLSLPAKAKREFVLWAVRREFSESGIDELDADQADTVKAALRYGKNTGGVSTAASPTSPNTWKWIAGVVIILVLAGMVAFLVQQSGARAQQLAVAETAAAELAAQREAEAAARPSSPTNLEYLNERIGKEVTLRGVPVKSEVGYLYFHEDPTMGVRVKLISGGVVVYQSSELEKWVQQQQEVEIRGNLIRHEEGVLEIPVDRQIQVKLVDPSS